MSKKSPNPPEHELLKPFLSQEKVISLARKAPDARIGKLLSVMTGITEEKYPQSSAPYFWDEARFELGKSVDYLALPQAIRTDLLTLLSRHSLLTSYYIEKGAISFCGKMAMMAESMDEKALYFAMGNEEVSHLLEFEKFIAFDPEQPHFITPFIRTLSDLIQDNDRITSFFVAQVLLEGMALSHYETLHETCLDEGLKKAIAQVLRDESAHHGSGLVLMNQETLEAEQVVSLTAVATTVSNMLVHQGRMLMETLRQTAEKHSVVLGPELLERIARDIDLHSQMKKRVHRLRESLSKLKDKALVSQLLQIPALQA
ncbi:MAG: ferritin-like domain-containing protein [Methylotenera sp.]|nr:ferritin-like domain-containing protein [Oligoflexia bacterium]